jgi:Outer membrane protein
MLKIKFFSVCLFMFFYQAISAQIYNLSLEESIEIAKKQSHEIQRLLQDNIIAENELKAATALLKTNVYMDFTLPQYTETVREWEDSDGISFFSIKTLRGIGSLDIRQPLPTDGTITMKTGLSAVNDYNTDKRASTFSTKLGLSQPLNSFWGYNAIRAELKRAKLNYERSNKALKRAELDIVYYVSSSYYELLQLQKGTEIYLMNLERQTEAHEISKNKFDAGLIREVENLQMEVDLTEAQNLYDITTLNFKSSTNSFKRLIGLELDATVTLKGGTENYKAVIINADKAVDMAMLSRLEIRDREIQIELQKLQISRQVSQGMPQASLEASWEKIGVSNLVVSESYSNSLSNTWDDLKARPSNYMVGLTLRIPIIDWGRNKRLVRAAESRLKQYYLDIDDEKRGIEVEVRNLVNNIQTTLTRLMKLENNVNVAEKSYGITLQRFTDGDIDSQALALERTRLNSAQRSHLDAYVSYRLLLSDLMRKTFYDFENDKPIE